MKQARYVFVLILLTLIFSSSIVFAQSGVGGTTGQGTAGTTGQGTGGTSGSGQTGPTGPGTTPNPPTGPYGIVIQNPFAFGDTLYAFISAVVQNVILPIGGVIAVIFIIYSGFLFVTARGNETKLATAKKAFLYTVIGTAILLGAWAISVAIQGTINQITK